MGEGFCFVSSPWNPGKDDFFGVFDSIFSCQLVDCNLQPFTRTRGSKKREWKMRKACWSSGHWLANGESTSSTWFLPWSKDAYYLQQKMHLGEETAKVGCEDLRLNIQQTSGYTMFHLHINFQTVLSVRRGYQISTGWLVQVSRETPLIYIYT